MKKDISLLIVDDELSVRDSLSNWFEADGYNVNCAENALKALGLIEHKVYQVILIDIKMPGMDGMELHRRIKTIQEKAIVIIMTAFASVETAVEALKEGAYDYICKPFDPDQLSKLVAQAATQSAITPDDIHQGFPLENVENIIGKSKPMIDIFEQIKVISQTASTVIIYGESGTGKELIANAIHVNSSRRYFPTVTVHCGAISESLLESELFGHERGAFTGASYHRKGKFEMANGGTLFLDEIGTISQKMQIELLRVLETKSFTRVGGNKEIKSDFRIICATNRDLTQLVKSGHFREDLYYRLNVITIKMPSLKERKDDIPLLIEYFIKKYNRLMNRNVKGINQKALNLLKNYEFPGNVRELENIIERAIVLCKNNEIRETDLPLHKGETLISVELISDVEKQHIKKILKKYDWNISRSAKVMGIDRVTLYNKIEKYGIHKSEQ
jgi:DNA-binding NtrC family response regulator